MKIAKTTLGICLVILLVITIAIARLAYSIGQHNASLTVKEVTPKQLAEAMQSDNFYGEYTQMMLLVNGKVKSVTHQNADTIVQFEVSDSPSALGKVSCDIRSNQTTVNAGATVHILTDAHDAQRQHIADVFMPNCYIIK